MSSSEGSLRKRKRKSSRRKSKEVVEPPPDLDDDDTRALAWMEKSDTLALAVTLERIMEFYVALTANQALQAWLKMLDPDDNKLYHALLQTGVLVFILFLYVRYGYWIAWYKRDRDRKYYRHSKGLDDASDSDVDRAIKGDHPEGHVETNGHFHSTAHMRPLMSGHFRDRMMGMV